MILLLLVSLIWAASFSLIKTHLVAVAPDVVNGLRLWLTLAVFLPFLRGKGLGGRRIAGLMASFQLVALGLGPVIASAVYDVFESYAAIYGLIAAGYLGSACFYLLARRPLPPPGEPSSQTS